jgi:hypothetical protein
VPDGDFVGTRFRLAYYRKWGARLGRGCVPHLSHWIAFFLDYFDAEARLVAADSRETRSHFFGLLFLIATALLLYLTSVLM